MIKIIDNFFDEVDAKNIEEGIQLSTFPWYYSLGSYKGSLSQEMIENQSDEYTYEDYLFSNVLINNAKFIVEESAPFVQLFVDKYCEKVGCRAVSMIRVKNNLQLRAYPDKVQNKLYNTPHIDTDSKDCTIAVYYVNDTDGPTYIFENDKKPWKILQKIEPKRNRLVTFSSKYYHAGMHPIVHDKRMVINFVFKIVE